MNKAKPQGYSTNCYTGEALPDAFPVWLGLGQRQPLVHTVLAVPGLFPLFARRHMALMHPLSSALGPPGFIFIPFLRVFLRCCFLSFPG